MRWRLEQMTPTKKVGRMDRLTRVKQKRYWSEQKRQRRIRTEECQRLWLGWSNFVSFII